MRNIWAFATRRRLNNCASLRRCQRNCNHYSIKSSASIARFDTRAPPLQDKFVNSPEFRNPPATPSFLDECSSEVRLSLSPKSSFVVKLIRLRSEYHVEEFCDWAFQNAGRGRSCGGRYYQTGLYARRHQRLDV